MIRTIYYKFKYKFKDQLYNYRKNKVLDLFKSKSGLEIGGSSVIFSNSTRYPIYKIAENLDNVNYSSSTIWEGEINSDFFNFYEDKKGKQFILEASDLNTIKSESYDFLLSSHCLEHCANALQTLHEWKRVLKKEGLLFLILPNKNETFDHKRPITTYEHLLSDYENQISEDDLFHLEEILKLHDLDLDKPAGNSLEFEARSRKNLENRCLHHHVFDLDLLKRIYKKNGIKILYTSTEGIDHIIIGKKI